jgi:hypothetical protein
LRKRLEALEKEVVNGRQSMKQAEISKVKAVNDFLSGDCLWDSSGLNTSEAKKMLEKERPEQVLKRVEERQSNIEKMHEHIRSH